MMSSKMLYQVDRRLREILQNNNPFGNVSILVVGDLYQLCPVFASHVFHVFVPDDYSEIAPTTTWELFTMYELTEIQRQIGDIEFCSLLIRMSRGEMTDRDIQLIRSRKVTDRNIPPNDAIRLFFTNQECENYNTTLLNTLNTETAVSYAYDMVEGNTFPQNNIILN